MRPRRWPSTPTLTSTCCTLPLTRRSARVIRILNPISPHLTIMRPLLAPSLLNVVVDNLRKGNAEGRLFEMSNIYIPEAAACHRAARGASASGLCCLGQ